MNSFNNSADARRLLLTVGAIVSPFVIMTVYLTLSRWPTRWFTPWSDLVAFAASIMAAVWLIWLHPGRVSLRITVAVVAIPVLGFVLFAFTLLFVCGAFGDCL